MGKQRMRKRSPELWLIVGIFCGLITCPAAAGRIIYVDAHATGANDGSSWVDAYKYLQDGLADANSGDEIWVADGMYRPDEDTSNPAGTGYRGATFRLKNGVGIYGGFHGATGYPPCCGETSRDERDPDRYIVYLSGDLNGNDRSGFINYGENSYHVVVASDTNETAVLDGFTVMGGSANGGTLEDNCGGGIYNESGSPTIANCGIGMNLVGRAGGGMYNGSGSPRVANCIFGNNRANYEGGGMCNKDGSYPTLSKCTFIGNSALHWGGGMLNYRSGPILTSCTFSGNSAELGGGVENRDYGSPTFSECTFSNNSAAYNGGGMYIEGSNVSLMGCTFGENQAGLHGGGMYNRTNNSTLTNCTFTGNSAGEDGGGLHNYESNATLTNCTFRGNSAARWGGGMLSNRSEKSLTNCIFSGNSGEYGGGISVLRDNVATLTNCVFSGNTATWGGAIRSDYRCRLTLTNCTFSGNSADFGNTVAFISVAQGYPSTFHVESSILWDGAGQIWNDDNSTLTAKYSDVWGGWPGEGNIDADPLFVEADGADGVDGTEDDNLRLLRGSPCINSGDPNYTPGPNETDLDGEPRVTGGRIDMGAYEGCHQGFVTSSRSVTVPEGGIATFEVALSLDPCGMVEVAVAYYSGDTDITVKSGGTLFFDPSNYRQAQTVTLGAREDSDRLNGRSAIRVSGPGIPTAAVIATERDNDTTLYVDSRADGDNNGRNWANAYNFLQDALGDAIYIPEVNEIHVAEGVYTPDSNTADPNGSGDRTATFELINGVAIRGGYAGFGAPDPNARDFELYESVLSGDLKGNDRDVNEPHDLLDDPYRAENCYHVVTGILTNANAVLDGFTVRGGIANGSGPYNTMGAGMYIELGSPTLTNCVFRSNAADHRAGGVYNTNNCYPRIENCTLIGNCGRSGGGMYNWQSSPTITKCKLVGNHTVMGSGGGMKNTYSDPVLTECLFIQNTAEYYNFVQGYGGGMYNRESSPMLDNCTFSGNLAEKGSGGGIYGGMPTVSNCIFWENRASTDPEIYGEATVSFSDVQGGWPGEGNINEDPCFADANSGDYHLMSEAGRWEPNSQAWVQDAVSSPCIDAGNPGCPLGDEPEDANNVRINMGAYGGTAEASKTPGGWRSIADLTNDWAVDHNDLDVFVGYWLESGECVPSDLSRDEEVDFEDFAFFGECWRRED